MNISRRRANFQVPAILAHQSPIISLGRGGRAVDRAGLENRKAERPREFESHPLRALKSYSYSYSCSYSPIFNERGLDVICQQRSVIGGRWVRARKNVKRMAAFSLSRVCAFCAQPTWLIQRLNIDGADMVA